MAIGINWAEIWRPVWNPVWRQTAIEPPVVIEPPQAGGGGGFGYRGTSRYPFEEFYLEEERKERERDDEEAILGAIVAWTITNG